MADERIWSREYKPSEEMCCEACVFGRGEHAWWCETGWEKDMEGMQALIPVEECEEGKEYVYWGLDERLSLD